MKNKKSTRNQKSISDRTKQAQEQNQDLDSFGIQEAQREITSSSNTNSPVVQKRMSQFVNQNNSIATFRSSDSSKSVKFVCSHEAQGHSAETQNAQANHNVDQEQSIEHRFADIDQQLQSQTLIYKDEKTERNDQKQPQDLKVLFAQVHGANQDDIEKLMVESYCLKKGQGQYDWLRSFNYKMTEGKEVLQVVLIALLIHSEICENV